MPAPDPSPTPRDLRRRQRQVSAYLSELRAQHGREPSRLRRLLRPSRERVPPDSGRRLGASARERTPAA